MARYKLRQTEERNLAIMEYFEDVNREYGELAPDISMTKKYTRVGEKFFLAPKTVAKIISGMSRNAGKQGQIRRVHPGE